jgi:hypothetical protein
MPASKPHRDKSRQIINPLGQRLAEAVRAPASMRVRGRPQQLSLGEHSALWLRLALVHAAILDTVALAAGEQQCESQDR